MSDKLTAIRDAAIEHFRTNFNDAMIEIERGMIAATDDAQANETEAKFAIGFSVKLNLDKNAATYALTINTRHKFESCAAIPDPNQPELKGIENPDERVIAPKYNTTADVFARGEFRK